MGGRLGSAVDPAARDAIRAAMPGPAVIGYTGVGCAACPMDLDPATIEAARRATNGVNASNHFNNTWWYDPICLGRYPEVGLEVFGSDMPDFPETDFDEMKQPIEFILVLLARIDGGEALILHPGSLQCLTQLHKELL